MKRAFTIALYWTSLTTLPAFSSEPAVRAGAFEISFSVTQTESRDSPFMEIRLEPAQDPSAARSFAKDSRVLNGKPVEISNLPALFLRSEYQRGRSTLLQRKPVNGGASENPECREKLILAVKDREKSEKWQFCTAIGIKDPATDLARSWLNFADQTLKTQLRIKLREVQTRPRAGPSERDR